MDFDNLKGKQFRGLRTRGGKLVKNRLGAFERSRSVEECAGSSRHRLRQIALDRETRFCTDEVLDCGCADPICSRTGFEIPPGGGEVFGEIDSADGGAEQLVMLLRFGADGKVSSAHMVDLDAAAERMSF